MCGLERGRRFASVRIAVFLARERIQSFHIVEQKQWRDAVEGDRHFPV